MHLEDKILVGFILWLGLGFTGVVGYAVYESHQTSVERAEFCQERPETIQCKCRGVSW